jgi:hypothetical protein
VTFHLYLWFGSSVRGGNSRVGSTGGNIVISMGKTLISMFLSTLVPRLAAVQRNLGGRLPVGHGLGFRHRPGFRGGKHTHSMHVDRCVLVGREMQLLGPRFDLPPIPMVRFLT